MLGETAEMRVLAAGDGAIAVGFRLARDDPAFQLPSHFIVAEHRLDGGKRHRFFAQRREPDGLALSSRNRYLSPTDRERALAIVSGLRHAHDAWHKGERHVDALRALVAKPVEQAFDRVDYVAAVDPDTLSVPGESSDTLLIAVAAHLGATRLIDNVVLGHDPCP